MGRGKLQAEVPESKTAYKYASLYNHVPSKVKSIRKTDDNLMKRSNKFDAEYDLASQQRAEQELGIDGNNLAKFPV